MKNAEVMVFDDDESREYIAKQAKACKEYIENFWEENVKNAEIALSKVPKWKRMLCVFGTKESRALNIAERENSWRYLCQHGECIDILKKIEEGETLIISQYGAERLWIKDLWEKRKREKFNFSITDYFKNLEWI